MPVVKYIPPMPTPNPPLVEGRVYRLDRSGWRPSGYFTYHHPKGIIIYLAHVSEPYGGWDEVKALDGRVFVEVNLHEV